MHEIDKAKFGTFVSELRKEKGYTQKELAEHLFISDKAISKWETGVSIPDASLWIPLGNLLGVTVTELLMCQRIEETAQMNSNQVEHLVKKAISCSDENPVLVQHMKRQRAAVFCICLAISCLENLYLYRNSVASDTLLTMNLLSITFGAYYMLMAKDKLPAFYDENKINFYSDGIFHMNMTGLAFNNSNWPYLVNIGRIWSMTVLVGYPIIYGVLSMFFPVFWNSFELYITLFLFLGGLFIPMYIWGKKYQ